MKYIILLSLVCLAVSSKSFLKQNSTVVTGNKLIKEELDPINVKSGSFENIAPGAKSIITPLYANPKADIKLNINQQAIVQRTENLGTTPIVSSKKVLDRSTGNWIESVDVSNQRILATTTNVANINTYHNVKVDLTTGKAINQIPSGELKTFGTNK